MLRSMGSQSRTRLRLSNKLSRTALDPFLLTSAPRDLQKTSRKARF